MLDDTNSLDAPHLKPVKIKTIAVYAHKLAFIWYQISMDSGYSNSATTRQNVSLGVSD